MRVKKPGRVSKACERCKRKKIKCDGSRPCLSCIGSQARCTYVSEIEERTSAFLRHNNSFIHDLQSAKYSFARLSSFLASNESVSFQRSFDDVTSFFNRINPQLHLRMDTEEIRSYHGTESLEAKIIGKQSRFLNRFSSSVANNGGQPVTLYFGIYSPLLFFTPMGMSWIIKKLISYSDDRGTRETVYLILKFLDVSSARYEATRKLRSNSPLKIYAASNGLPYDEEKLIDRIVFEITGDSKHKFRAQFARFENEADWFALSVDLMQQHHKALNRSKLEGTRLKVFLEKDESILSLCTEYLGRSIFTEMNDTSLLKSLLLFVELRFWIDDFFFLGKIISAICRRCLDAGLNRWEYYVAKEESVANEQRKLWWNCFWWDRWSASMSGKPPLLSDEMNWCLFPSEVMQLGVDDSMDCLTLLDSVNLDAKKVDACVSFGRILLAKLITNVFSTIIYSRKFTDYRLSAMQSGESLGDIATELKIEFSSISKMFTNFQVKLIPFLKTNFKEKAFLEFYIHLAFTTISCFRAIESLIIRVQNLLQAEQKVEVIDCLVESRQQVFSFSIDILLSVLKSNESILIIKCSYPIFTAILNMTAHFLAKPGDNPLYHLSLLCGMISLYNDYMSSFSSADVKGGVAWRKLRGVTISSFILTRICCQTHMRSQRITNEELTNDLKKYDISCAETARLVLDIECIWYRDLISNNKQSGYSKEILNHIHKDIGDFSSNSAGDAQDNNISESTQSSRNITMADFGSLENFVASDASLEFLNNFWNDIELDIFD